MGCERLYSNTHSGIKSMGLGGGVECECELVNFPIIFTISHSHFHGLSVKYCLGGRNDPLLVVALSRFQGLSVKYCLGV